MRDVSIKCTCGKLAGRVSTTDNDPGKRTLCYCKDCQSFAYFLSRADQILDAHGGTDIFQVSPAHFVVEAGFEQLACMRLKPKGLLRWYTRCCNTPIGNTMASRKLPFIGLVHTCIDHDERSLDEILGPIETRIHGRSAQGDVSDTGAHESASIGIVIDAFSRILARRLRGAHKRSALFQTASGDPVVEPHVLTEDELRDVESRRDAE